MGVRDALLLNTTGSNFEALQSNDTARIKGDFSVKNTSDTEIFGVDVSAATVNVAGNITSSMNMSGSRTSTGSFGRIVATDFHGDGLLVRDTLTRSSGLITASAQLAPAISGAFNAGFFFGFEQKSSISGGLGITGSFGRLEGVEFYGNGFNIRETLPRSTGLLSSSKQIATQISGAFNKGFEFTGEISGSRTSTGSFGRVEAVELVGDATNLHSTLPYSTGLVTASAQLANQISGSFNKGFEFTGTISGSSASTGSFGRLDAVEFHGDATNITSSLPYPTGMVSSSAQLASRISGSFTSGFTFTTTSSLGHATGSLLSASAGGTANLTADKICANKFVGDGSFILPLYAPGLVTGSAQLASRISGSFTKGFTYQGQISGSATSTGSFGRVDSDDFRGDGSKLTNLVIPNVGAISGSKQISSRISGSFNKGFEFTGTISGSSASTGSFGYAKGIKLAGDGTNLSSSILAAQTVLSASSQIRTYISGAFTSGFELFSRQSGSANQRKSYYVGVSGSEFFNAGNDTTMSISSICGSDFDYRLFDTVNQIKGRSYGTGVWSTTTAMPAVAHGRAMAGTQNAFLSAGAYSDPNTTKTQKFDGASWSVSAALINTGRAAVGVGTQNAMGVFGGYNPGFSADDKSEFYNGAAWSNGPNMGTTRGYGGAAGTQNGALIYGGIVNSPATKRTETELYDGNTFTETADLSSARGLGSSGGTQNDAIMAGGLGTPTGITCTEIWNGASWTEVANLNTNRWNHTGIGTANHMVVVTGHAGGTACTNTEEWNGTSWSEVSDLINLRAFLGGAAGGLGCQGIIAGGYAYPGNATVGTTELWNSKATTTGSFGLLEPRGGKIDTKVFQITSSLFKLPVFSDKDLNYQAHEAEYSTGSLSGSVDRVADVIVGQKLGEMWFDSDKNAIGYTYSSRSLYSQSLSFGEFANISASGNYVSCSQGFFTQSFYSHSVVTCYLTGSQT